MVVAIVAVHTPNGFFAQANGYELPLLYAIVALMLAVGGPGTYSLDAALGLDAVWEPTIAWIVTGGAVAVGLANAALRRTPSAAVATADR